MFRHADCPCDKTFFNWVSEQLGWKQGPVRFEPEIQIPGFTYDCQALRGELHDLTRSAPVTSWRSQAPGAVFGMSLHHDPDGPSSERYCGSFGHPRYKTYSPADYFKVPMMDIGSAVKGDYLDEFAFRSPIPEIKHMPELRKIWEWFSRPVLRGTLRILLGDKAVVSMPDGGGMHTDQPPEMAVRINLTVQSSPSFGLEYEGFPPVFTESGGYRVVCTDVNHRVYVKNPDPIARVHVVFDVVPWFDYDRDRDAWTPNEFFMKKHPYDMIVDGDFGPRVGAV